MSMAWNQARILERVRVATVYSSLSQSREGPAVPGAPLAVMISQVWPFFSGVFSGTMTPSTRAPRQRWPTSLCRW